MGGDPEDPELGGTLFLEDGTRFEGRGLGAVTSRVGEVVFTTGMAGYPESLTDPSYRGQILTFTYPLLGNYGVPTTSARDRFGLPAHLEAERVQVRGMVARGLTRPNHWGSDRSLQDWLASEEVPIVVGIDTRRLTEHLRSRGVLRGVVDVGPLDGRPSDRDLRHRLERAPAYADEPLVAEAAVREPVEYDVGRGPWVAVLDCGVKASIVRALLTRRTNVVRVPWDQPIPDRWEGHRISGLLVGNGPGDPSSLGPAIDQVRGWLETTRPTLGICLGHQLIALAEGGSTFKLKYGHRGQNKTIVFPDGRAMIVSENHGFAVDPDSLKASSLAPWAVNPDDRTLEGLRDPTGRILALQGHPEGHPGPQEAGFVFDQFVETMRRKSP